MVVSIILIIAVVALMVALGIYGSYAAEQRRKALVAWGQAHGLMFNADKAYGLDDRYPDFDCLRSGSNRYAYNTLTGAYKNWSCRAFDYHYETRSTDSKGRQQTQHHHFSAAIIDSPVPLKPLFIRPEGLFDKVKEFFGMEDIDFESAEFSRKFYVKAPDRKWAYDVIHPRTMEFMLSMPMFTLRLAGSEAIVYRGTTFKPEEFSQAIEVLTGILERLPDYAVKQLLAEAPHGAQAAGGT